MNRELTAGVVLTVAGILGYVVGIAAVYPGRSFSITAMMVGIALVIIGRSGEEEHA